MELLARLCCSAGIKGYDISLDNFFSSSHLILHPTHTSNQSLASLRTSSNSSTTMRTSFIIATFLGAFFASAAPIASVESIEPRDPAFPYSSFRGGAAAGGDARSGNSGNVNGMNVSNNAPTIANTGASELSYSLNLSRLELLIFGPCIDFGGMGGTTTSGPATGGQGVPGGNAYSGYSGSAIGGSVSNTGNSITNTNSSEYSSFVSNIRTFLIVSTDTAGGGGTSTSGNAVGGNARRP